VSSCERESVNALSWATVESVEWTSVGKDHVDISLAATRRPIMQYMYSRIGCELCTTDPVLVVTYASGVLHQRSCTYRRCRHAAAVSRSFLSLLLPDCSKTAICTARFTLITSSLLKLVTTRLLPRADKGKASSSVEERGSESTQRPHVGQQRLKVTLPWPAETFTVLTPQFLPLTVMHR
jgi:hypothetical protein